MEEKPANGRELLGAAWAGGALKNGSCAATGHPEETEDVHVPFLRLPSLRLPPSEISAVLLDLHRKVARATTFLGQPERDLLGPGAPRGSRVPTFSIPETRGESCLLHLRWVQEGSLAPGT